MSPWIKSERGGACRKPVFLTERPCLPFGHLDPLEFEHLGSYRPILFDEVNHVVDEQSLVSTSHDRRLKHQLIPNTHPVQLRGPQVRQHQRLDQRSNPTTPSHRDPLA